MPRVLYDDPGILYDDPDVLYEQPVPEAPKGIEAWVTEPDGTYLAHLDRSEESPFRFFSFSLIRNQSGVGTLEYHLDNAQVDETPTLLDLGNLVWMRYRDQTMTWIIEDERAVLDEQESATDWRKVSGRGSLQLLGDRIVFPTPMANGANLDPSLWATQWRSFVNRAAGEMLWDIIVDTNVRFATQITRGTVETTGSDGWTQDFRFDNVLTDVVDSVTASYGDVVMDGLEFNYYNSLGTDKRESVIFEEGADLLSLTHDVSDRERVSYIVGEGVGEGVFAKLAIAQRSETRRIEGFYAAKDATNLPLLQNLTNSALTEHTRRETVSFEAGEYRYKAFTDFELGDVVRAISPSRGVDTAQRIDAIYVAEDGDKVRIALDLNGLRDDELLKLNAQAQATRSQIGIVNRQPQGQLTSIGPTSESVVFDETTANGFLFDLLEDVYVTVRVKVAVAFKPYFAPATAADASGDLTSNSGGGSTSGASSASSSASGGSSTPTSGSGDNIHNHDVLIYVDDTPPGGLVERHYVNSTGVRDFAIKSTLVGDLTSGAVSVSHTHSVTIGGHQHDISHTHTTPAHQHTTPTHGHDLVFLLHNEAYPASHDVACAIYEYSGSSWDLVTTVSGLTNDVEEFYVEQYVDGPGLWRFEFESAAGQPNSGRLAADVSVAAIGAIKSA